MTQPFFFRGWRDHTPQGRVILVAALFVGVAAAWLLPDPAGEVYTWAIVAVSGYTIWRWHRRRKQPPTRLPTTGWETDGDSTERGDAGQTLN